jgi:predicted secreted protein
MKRRLTALLAGCIAGAVQAGALVDLSAEASRPAANDMVRASVFSEASGKNPAELALRVNADIAEALKLIRAKAGVSVKSGQQATYPIYGQSQKIDGWRMRSGWCWNQRIRAAFPTCSANCSNATGGRQCQSAAIAGNPPPS